MGKGPSEEALLQEIEELRQELYRLKTGKAEPQVVEEVSARLDSLLVELMKRRRAAGTQG
ncbi:MAG: aspartyl-phosphate phosphatase Spo0E family protein [Bacillota bacterium]|nr:aspartyl-phosphate phosphatase Spo0E family protein [Bacillota bacterium]